MLGFVNLIGGAAGNCPRVQKATIGHSTSLVFFYLINRTRKKTNNLFIFD